MPTPTTLPGLTAPHSAYLNCWNGSSFYAVTIDPEDIAPVLALAFDYRPFRAPEGNTWRQSGTGRRLPQDVTLNLRVDAGGLAGSVGALAALEGQLAQALNIAATDETGEPMLYREILAHKTFSSGQRFIGGGVNNPQTYLMAVTLTLGRLLKPLSTHTGAVLTNSAGVRLLATIE